MIVAITLSAAGAFFAVPLTKNTIGGEAKTSNAVEADRLTIGKEEEVIKGAGVVIHGRAAYYGANDQGDKSISTIQFSWSLAGTLLSITVTKMMRKTKEMEQIEWDQYQAF